MMNNKLKRIEPNELILDSLSLVDKIKAIEPEMLKYEQVDCPVRHHFGPGVYMREVTIPAGTIAVGHHQNLEHMNHFVKGRVIVINEDGSTSDLVAPMLFTGNQGRKMGYIVEDVIWYNIYPTSETNVEILEETYLTKSDDWLSNNQALFDIEKIKRHADISDFQLMLQDLGVTESVVREQSENKTDQIEMPVGSFKMTISDSPIEGLGIFATASIDAGEVIAPARIDGKRTPAGRYTNHSAIPNARMKGDQYGSVDLVAIKPICGMKGGNAGEEITIDYRQAVNEAAAISEKSICQE